MKSSENRTTFTQAKPDLMKSSENRKTCTGSKRDWMRYLENRKTYTDPKCDLMRYLAHRTTFTEEKPDLMKSLAKDTECITLVHRRIDLALGLEWTSLLYNSKSDYDGCASTLGLHLRCLVMRPVDVESINFRGCLASSTKCIY